MKNELDQINKKLDKISEHMNDIKIDVSKNTVDLSHHIKRTDLLEQDLRKQGDTMSQMQKDMISHTSKVRGIGIVASLVISILLTILGFKR